MSEKILVPDGLGGYKKVDAKKFSDGAKTDKKRQERRLREDAEKASLERIGKAAEAFNKMHKAYATDFALDVDELIKAMYLEILNWKEFYPKDMGGPAQFDAYCEEIFRWFEENKNKP